MKVVALLAGLAVLALAGFAVWVRIAPSVPEKWHVDPLTVTERGKLNSYLLADGGDAPALRVEMAPAEAAARLEAIALATPRTRRLAGQGEFVTYVTRSRLWGFPDYTSVRFVPVAGGCEIAIFARSRFGESDLGVNRKRVEDWVRQLAS